MSLKPDQVIEAVADYYKLHPSCHNRAVHEFGEKTTKKVKQARVLINKYINSRPDESIVFTRNTTESINMISKLVDLREGDIVLTTDMEHNSNMLPWQFLSIEKKVKFQQVPITATDCDFNLAYYEQILKTKKVKLVSIFHVSNITGMELPVKQITELAHRYGAKVLLDAAQSMAHQKVDVQDLGIDFMAFSIHKMFGPTGVGVLYARGDFLKKAIPINVGGEGIVDTTYNTCTLEKSPEKYEVGLQNYAGIIGAGEAIKYLEKIPLEKAKAHIHFLNEKITMALDEMKNIQIIGPPSAKSRAGIINFMLKDKKPEEISLLLSKMARIMVRSGVHCGHSWYHRNALKPSIRVSLSFYNTEEEVDILIRNLKALMGT